MAVARATALVVAEEAAEVALEMVHAAVADVEAAAMAAAGQVVVVTVAAEVVASAVALKVMEPPAVGLPAADVPEEAMNLEVEQSVAARSE